MFCNQCGKEIPNGVKFCPTCGAPVPQTNETTDFQQTTATGTGAMAGSGMGTETVTNPKLGSLTLPGTTKTVQWILSCVVGGMQFLSAVIFWWIGLFAVSASVSMFGMSQNQSESVSLHDLFDWKFFSVFFMILVFISAVWTILRVVDEKMPLSFLSPVRPIVRFFAPLLSLVTGALTLIVFLFQWITGAGEVADALSSLGSFTSSLASVSFHITFWGVLFLLFTLATIVISAYLLVCELSRKKTTPQAPQMM